MNPEWHSFLARLGQVPFGGLLAGVVWLWGWLKRTWRRMANGKSQTADKKAEQNMIETGRELGNEEKELLRHAVLECLVARHPAALPVSGVARRIRGELDFGIEEPHVEAALEFLKSQGWATSQFDEMGGSKWWTATAAGCLKVERSS